VSPQSLLPARSLRLRKVLSLPKAGDPSEDRWAASPSAGRWALCDGASEGFDSSAWAHALAQGLARSGATSLAVANSRAAIAHSRATLAREAGGRMRDPGWLELRARSRGSWSTALLVEASPRGRSVLVSAIGDSCLLVLDGFALRSSFPMQAGDSFTSTPDLLGDCESPSLDPPFRRARIQLAGLRRPQLLLATDALAARLLATQSDRDALFRFLRSASPAAFAAWARDEIAQGTMARDDLCLLWVS